VLSGDLGGKGKKKTEKTKKVFKISKKRGCPSLDNLLSG